MSDISGKSVLVTGASGGIGAAIARQLHGMGRVHGDGHTELFHFRNTEHIHDEIIVAEAGAAIAQDDLHIGCGFA